MAGKGHQLGWVCEAVAAWLNPFRQPGRIGLALYVEKNGSYWNCKFGAINGLFAGTAETQKNCCTSVAGVA